MDAQPKPMPGAVRAYAYLGTLVAAYIGVYLVNLSCRQALSPGPSTRAHKPFPKANKSPLKPNTMQSTTDGPGLTRELEAFNGD